MASHSKMIYTAKLTCGRFTALLFVDDTVATETRRLEAGGAAFPARSRQTSGPGVATTRG